ncbi:MAG: ATP-binding cassette domain-containing protein [Egibacteraceae bacterium]
MSLSVDVRAAIGEFRLDARFALPEGLTVLFGPSGAGKTRLLRLVAGLDAPAEGRIGLGPTVFADTTTGTALAPHRRRIGMVFQQPYLLPHRTVAGNVALAAAGAGRAERRARAEELLARVDAAALAARRPGELSGGQRQRVALARALAGEPRLLLLDEPFGALDVPVRRQLRALVRRLVDEAGVPTVFVTHDPAELAALADQVLLADDGDISVVTDAATALARLDGPAGGGRG